MSKGGELASVSGREHHVPWLDGLRGVAASWVFVSHVVILTGTRSIPLVSNGSLAVDLFMLLSGFLMAHHYYLRRQAEPWTSPRTFLVFWIRRIFRIAPLYYPLLLLALWMGPWLSGYREVIASIWPTAAGLGSRYTDQSLANIFAHLSFVFGFLPEYAFRTPLPDWSIGLEMEFYFVFPVLMLAISQFGAFRVGLCAIAACLLLEYRFAVFFHRFGMPSFLPMKLYLFIIGIWMALSRLEGSMSMRRSFCASALVTSAIFAFQPGLTSLARILMVLAVFYLVNNGSLPSARALDRLISRVRTCLSGAIGRFLGDTSYGTYLLHLLIVVPVAGMLARQARYVESNELVRFSVCLVLAAAFIFPLSWLLHRTLESNGVRAGKYIVLNFIKSSREAAARG
jgi:peptidoglycan/LPS O-acetylase OafA/YrhL